MEKIIDGKLCRSVGDSEDLFIVVGSTETLKEFGSRIGTSHLDVVRNPHTGSLFLTDDRGKAVGTVKKDYTSLERPVMSEFYSERQKSELNPSGFFMMMHQKGYGEEPLATFSCK